MKVEYRIYMGIGVFVLLVMTVYFFWAKDYGGATMLFGTAGLGIMPALYFGWWKRRMDPRPEDSETATVAESKGAIGAFPANNHSRLTWEYESKKYRRLERRKEEDEECSGPST